MDGDISFCHRKGSKRAMLLLHGLTGTPSELLYMAKAIYREGYDVFCPTLPGHLTTNEKLLNTTWNDWYVFSKAKLDELLQKYDDVFCGGVCIGSNLSLLLASENTKVKGYILCSPILFLNGWNIPFYVPLLWICMHSPLKYFCVFPENGPLGVKNKDVREKIRSSFNKTGSALDFFPILSILELLRLSKHLKSRLKKVKEPVLVCHAKEDDLANLKNAFYIMKKNTV